MTLTPPHKSAPVNLSSKEQSTRPKEVKRALKASLRRLQLNNVDSFLVHSPLTDSARRLGSWQALLELQEEGLCRSIGVANFGPQHLEELRTVSGEAPQVLQLELSPYNQHRDCTAWAAKHDVAVTCAAWSKLSGTFNWGSDEKYRAMQAIAKAHGATRAQVLVRWAVQRGFGALPRSGTGSSAERLAIRQNSADGSGLLPESSASRDMTWSGGPLTAAEMTTLDGFEEQLPAGRLGRLDGWSAGDVGGSDWDPTR